MVFIYLFIDQKYSVLIFNLTHEFQAITNHYALCYLAVIGCSLNVWSTMDNNVLHYSDNIIVTYIIWATPKMAAPYGQEERFFRHGVWCANITVNRASKDTIHSNV